MILEVHTGILFVFSSKIFHVFTPLSNFEKEKNPRNISVIIFFINMQLKFLYLKFKENLVGLPPQKSNDGEFIVVASKNMALLLADQKFQ